MFGCLFLGRSSRSHQARNQVLESDCRGKEAEPKAASPVLCRRSPRGRKKSKRKIESKVEVSYSRARRTACKTPTEGQGKAQHTLTYVYIKR